MTTTTTRKRRRWRWRTIFAILTLLIVVGAIVAVFVARSMLVPETIETASLTTLVVPVEQRTLAETVQVNGSLEPRDTTSATFPENARVSEILVNEGDRVRRGQVLARLETRDLELKVTSTTSQVDQAQQELDKLLAGPSEAELAQAAAKVGAARADLANNAREVRPVDIENARTQLELARKRLTELQNGEATDEQHSAEQQLISAQDSLTAAEVSLASTRDTASLAKTQAQQAMERGGQDLEKAQRAYSDAKNDWEYVQRTGRHPREKAPNAEGREENVKLDSYRREDFRRAFVDAEVAMHNAEVTLQNLLEAYDQAREDEVRQVQAGERSLVAAQRAVDDAQRALDQQREDALPNALLQARKEVADAEKAYNDLANNPTRPATRAELEAALLAAIADQEKLAAGPDPVAVAKARTALEEARAALAKAEADLAAATLAAPIDGTVVDISLEVGTITTASSTIDIADLSAFLIRGQVSEQNVADVRAGQPVSVTVDAVPGMSYGGRLLRVSELPDTSETTGSQTANFGVNPSGALGGVYPVEIVIDASEQRLRVGMATTAYIELFALPNALVIPLQAVEQGPGGPFVRKATGAPGPDGVAPSVETPVELGQANGDSVQILKGLQLGDSVVVNQLPPLETPQFGPGR